MRSYIPAIMLAMISAPAYAWSGTQIPEPSNIALFGLGLTGLLIGRRIARKKGKSDED